MPTYSANLKGSLCEIGMPVFDRSQGSARHCHGVYSVMPMLASVETVLGVLVILNLIGLTITAYAFMKRK